MRSLLLLPLLAAAILPTAAYAQSPSDDAPSKRQSLESSDEYKSRVQAWLLDCTQSWDAGTHMTKQQWEHSCRRAAKERVKYLMENRTLKGTQ